MASRSLNVVITGDSRGLNRMFDQTESRSKRWGVSMAKGFAAVGAAAGAGLAVGLKKSADAAIEAEKAQATMVAQLKASGISYRAHAKQIDEVIQKHSKLSGLDDEDLQRSFTNIVRVTGDVNQALKLNGLAADFARAKGMDVAKAGELVGKVAGGNVGILSRYGIVLKDGATSADALAVLQRKFAGQAEAYGKTTAGALDRAGVASENLGEIVGAKLTPLLAKGATALVELVDKAGKLGGPIRQASGIASDAYNTIARAVRRFARDNEEEIQTAIQAARNLARAVRFVFEEVLLPVIRTVIKRIVPILDSLKDTLSGLVRFVTNVLTGQWGKAWDAAKDTVSGALRTVKNVIVGFGDVLYTAVKALGGVIIKGLVAGLKGLAGAITRAVVAGAKAGFERAKDAVVGAAKSLGGALIPGIGDGAGRIGEGIGKNIWPQFGGGLMGARPELAPIAGMASRFGLGVTSGLRPGAITSSGNQSWHATGEAIDVSGPASGMMGFARFMSQRAGSLAELIYTPLGAWSNGSRYTPTGKLAADHYDHVHVAMDVGAPGQGDGIGQAASAARAAGFRGQALINAVAVAGAESRYDAQAKNLKYPDHSIGMWQINQLAHKGRYGSDTALMNPFVNARAAWKISGGGRNWSPWSTWPSAAQGWMARARAAVSGGGGGRGGGSGGNTAIGGGGGRGSVEGGPGNTASGVGDTGRNMGALSGPGASLGMEGQLARVGVREARAQASDNLAKLIAARVAKRRILRARLATVTKALKGKMRKARRVRLLNEQAELIEEIDALTESIKEYKADQGGGATTISRADELEAGVDTSVSADTGGTAGGGGTTTSDSGASDLAAAIRENTSAIEASRRFAEQVQQTEAFQLKKYLADVLSGQIVGYGVVPRSFTPGSGVEFVY